MQRLKNDLTPVATPDSKKLEEAVQSNLARIPIVMNSSG
jgi:hypothetical protein